MFRRVLSAGRLLQVLERWLPRLWRGHAPQLVIFQAGVDALAGDAYGRSVRVQKGPVSLQACASHVRLAGCSTVVLR